MSNCTVSGHRLFFPLLLALVSLQPNRFLLAATYYVSQANGDDNYTTSQAVDPVTPWRTIQKAATNVVAGDTVIIRAGTYREMISVSHSGTSNAPITFQNYPDETVVISGANPVDGWILESPNIYYAPVTLKLGNGNQIFQNNRMTPEARWPNAGANFPWQNSAIKPSPDWAYVATAGYSSGVNGWITCPQLPSRTNGYWNGGTLHIMAGYGWVMAVPTITSYVDSTKTIVTTDANGPKAAYAFTAGNEFYVSGKKGELDSPGEWWYDSANSRLYFYSTNTPTNVEAKVRAIGFDLRQRAFIQIKNLNFFACTIWNDSGSTDHLYDGISMRYVMHSKVPFSTNPSATNRLVLEDRSVLRNSEIAFASGSMVYLEGKNIRVINNNIHDAGYTPDFYPMLSCNQAAQQNLISHNSIHDGGRALLSYLARESIVEYNDFSNGMKLATDGAPVYDVNDASAVIFHHNLVHDSTGPVGHGGFGILGVYLDSKDSNWTLHHNIVWNIPSYGFCFSTLFEYDCVFNNTWANCGAGLYSSGVQTQDAGTTMYNNLFSGTIVGSSWSTADMRYNLHTNPGFIAGGYALQSNSIAIDSGVPVPGVTDGYVGPAPDLGALERGGDDWTTKVGYSATPPSPDPAYDYPDLEFANKLKDGSFESGSLSPNWNSAPGGNAVINSANAWTSAAARSGYFSLAFGSGTSQVGQTITNLLPASRYVYYAAISATTPTATIAMGVTNYGSSVQEMKLPSTNGWCLYNLSFVTGPTNTSATIYIRVTSSDNVNKVYADDFGVVLRQPPFIAPQNPLVFYPLDETNGLTAFDTSGHGKNGTLNNGPATSWTNGIRRGAIYFNGSDVLLTPAITTPTNGLTVACWARSVSSTWNAYGCLISQRPSFVIHPVKGSKEVRFLVSTNSTTAANADWIPPGNFDITQWHHYAGVYDANKQLDTLYVDGTLVAQAIAPAIYPTTRPINIGKDDYTLDNLRNFIGSIDDARIYSYALSPSQVQTLAKTNNGLMLHLALDDAAGSASAMDSTGLGGNGTLVNMTTASVWTNGILNGALNFDGVDDRVVTPAIQTPSALTVSCWARSATANWNATGCLVSHRPAFSLNPIQGTHNLQFVLYTSAVNTVAADWSAPADFDITQWHLYTGVFDPSNHLAALYVDGLSVATVVAAAINMDNGPIFVGQDSLGGANCNFKGTIDDVRLYSRALSWNEILDLAHLTSQSPYSFAIQTIYTSQLGSWRQRYFGTAANTGAAADTADPDGDGMINSLEYMLGRNPTNSDAHSALIGAVDGDGEFTLTFPRADPAVTYTVECTTNLYGVWSPLVTNPLSANGISTVADNTPLSGSRFFRLKMTPP